MSYSNPNQQYRNWPLPNIASGLPTTQPATAADQLTNLEWQRALSLISWSFLLVLIARVAWSIPLPRLPKLPFPTAVSKKASTVLLDVAETFLPGQCYLVPANGFCYLWHFRVEDWGPVAEKLRFNPPAHRVRAEMKLRLQGKWGVHLSYRGRGQWHADPINGEAAPLPRHLVRAHIGIKNARARLSAEGREYLERLERDRSAFLYEDGRPRPGVFINTHQGQCVYDTDLTINQPLGHWSFGGQVARHYGPYMGPRFHEDEQGWCYLALFAPRYRRTVERHLGAYPTGRSLADYAKWHRPWLQGNERFVTSDTGCVAYQGHLIPGVAHVSLSNTEGGGRHPSAAAAHLGHANHVGAVLDVAAAGTRLGKTRVNMQLFGTQGVSLPPARPAPPMLVEQLRDGFNSIAPGEMYRANEAHEGKRSPDNPGLHFLDPSVIARTRNCAGPSNANEERRATLWAGVARATRQAVSLLPANACVVVTATSGDSGEIEKQHPRALAPGADFGLLYVTTFRDPDTIDPFWRQIAAPLEEGEGRLLASFRLLPAFTGRSDMDFLIVNYLNHNVRRKDMRLVADSGLAYGAVSDMWVPTNLGCWFTQGCLFESDADIVAASFAADGGVYGWDEAILYTRNPVVVITDRRPGHRFDQFRLGTTFENVTWLQSMSSTDGPRLLGAHYNLTTRADAINYDARGLVSGTFPAPNPLVQSPWKPLCDVEREAHLTMGRLNIAEVDPDHKARLPRYGKRACNANIIVGGLWFTPPGGQWRGGDRMFGLRSRLVNYVTQGINPELWALTLEGNHNEIPGLRSFVENAAYAVLAHELETEPDGVVGIASVKDQGEAERYHQARGSLFTRWVWLSEDASIQVTGRDLTITLPTVRGNGYIYQLARLLPLAFGHPEQVYSCVNDLETDMMPRSERLQIAIDALEHTQIVFPSMAVFHPCPFQDVTGYGRALADKSENLIWAISTFGWVYGYDEVWCGAHQLPTLPLRLEPMGIATPHVSNPQPAWLWDRIGGGYRTRLCAGGDFYSVLSGLRPTLRTTYLLPGLFNRVRNWLTTAKRDTMTWSIGEWQAWVRVRLQRQYQAGEKIIVIFRWGTHGDRVPLTAAGRTMAQAGAQVHFVDLCTPAEGKEMLAYCESESGHNLVKDVLKAIKVVRECPVPHLAPEYLYPGALGLPYSLRPADKCITRIGGGLHRLIDWACQLTLQPRPDMVRIGAFKGTSWFPRSADGETYLAHKPRPPNTGGRKGWVGGSSTLPVPAEYIDWEHIPAGDHQTLFKEFEVVACAGGAGVVQTAAMAGARVHTWSDCIDRAYRDEHDAGRGVEGNEESHKWLLVVATFYPSFWRVYLGRGIRTPGRVLTAVLWNLRRYRLVRKTWTTLFIAYSLRFTVILPSLESTLLRMAGFKVKGLGGLLSSFLAKEAIRLYLLRTGQTWFSVFPRFLWDLAGALLSGEAAFLTALGFHPMRAGVFTVLWRRMGGTDAVLDCWRNLKWGTITVTDEPGVWLCLSPAHIGGFPIGLHAALFDSVNGVIYEGRHQSGNMSLGSPFRLERYERPYYKCMFALPTSADPLDLPKRQGPIKPYSLIWNCQTVVATMLFKHGRALAGIQFALLFLGMGWAFLGLGFFYVAMLFAGSISLLALHAATPLKFLGVDGIDSWLEWAWRELEQLVPQFAHGQEEMTDDEILTQGSSMAAAAIAAGADEDIVFTAMRSALPSWVRTSENNRPSDELHEHLYVERRGATELGALGLPGGLRWLAGGLSEGLRAINAPRPQVEGLIGTILACSEGIEKITTEVVVAIGAILDTLEDAGVTGPTRCIANILAAALENAGVSTSERKKNVWAILASKDISRFARSDWMRISADPWILQETDGRPIKKLYDNINSMFRGNEKLTVTSTFTRPQFLPSRPRVGPGETRYPSLLDTVQWQLDPSLSERASKYSTLGGAQGIDGMWQATTDNRLESISRYSAPEMKLDEESRALAHEVAEMLFEKHNAAFVAPQVVSPETVWKHIVKKYSPGLPWIGRYRTRADLATSGWMQALINATYKRLEDGEYPPQVYHAFAKMQIVDAEKAGQPGKLRTVVAQDLQSVFVDQVVQLERNKRITWEQGMHGIGMPATARVMGKIVDRVAERKTTFSADVTAFDSFVPEFGWELLTRLAELGSAQGGPPQVAEVLRTKYLAMRTATIVDLPSGHLMDKMRGGGTGQSATSWDNTWAMRGLMVALWSVATNQPAAEFYDHNTVHNTGDDNIWGTDSDLDPDKLAEIAKTLFGMTLRIETRGQPDELSYLGKKVVSADSVRADLNRVGVTDQNWTVAPLRKQLLMRRSAIVSRHSGRPEREYLQHILSKTVGHAALCHHDRELYDVIAHEWCEDAAKLLKMQSAPIFQIRKDQDGHVEDVVICIPESKPLSPQQQNALKRLRTSLALPSYQKVLEDAYRERPAASELSPYEHARVRQPLEVTLRKAIASVRTWLNQPGSHALAGLLPASSAAPFSQLFHTPGYPVERFVFRKLLQGDPGAGQTSFAYMLRLAPFSIATDPNGFWWYTQLPGVREDILAEDFLVIKGRMVIATIAYALIAEWIRAARMIPWFGLVVEIWQMWNQDLTRYYAMLNHAYWLGTADSSTAISSLMPKDPYATPKKIAVYVSAYTPESICRIAAAILPDSLLQFIPVSVARLRTLWARAVTVDVAVRGDEQNPWDAFIETIWSLMEGSRSTGLVLKAPTGTGKSTYFVGALAKKVEWKRTWLLVPRIVLRENYSNPTWNPEQIDRLSRTGPDTGKPLAILTYGYFVGLVTNGKGPQPGDVVLFDEFHENDPEMGLAWFLVRGKFNSAFLSATPNNLYAPEARFFEVPIPRRFKEPLPVRLPLTTIDLFFEAAREYPEYAARALIIVPSLAEVRSVLNAVTEAGFQASPMDRNHREAPATGVIVATQIVDSGVTITPPPQLLIDCGERLAQSRGILARRPSDIFTEAQRRGRVARIAEGVVFTNYLSGTGDPAIPYPTWTRLVSCPGAQELLGILGIDTSMLEHPENPSDIDPYMSLHLPLAATWSRDIVRGVSAIWAFRCELGGVEAGNERYDIVQTSGWGEHENGIRDLLRSKIGGEFLPSRALLTECLRDKPFHVCFQQHTRSVEYLQLVNGTVAVV